MRSVGGKKDISRAMTACVMSFALLVLGGTASGAPAFDHTKTGFLLRDVHATLKCEQCHVDGIFKNTPKDCAGCHSIGSRVGATPKPVNHVQTTSPCDTCHTSPTSFLVKSFKHIGITSGCSFCHNRQSAGVVSKPAHHFPTLLPCETCHTSTNTFQSWRMDHTGITSGCASCHDGQYAGIVRKPAAHIATTAACEACHASTTTFLDATFSHATVAVAGLCNSCHLGQYPGVVSQPANHIPSAGAQCDLCHTTANTGGYTSFIGGDYNHASAVPPLAAGNCSGCHTGQRPGVPGKPANHIPTSAQCDTCHTAANTRNYVTFLGAPLHTVPPGVCSTCHNGVYATGKSAVHIPTTDACDACHTQANTGNYTAFLGATYAHAAPIGVCSTCHNGLYARGKPTTHIFTTAACDSCHTQSNTSNYTTFLGAIHTHTVPIGVCSTCHNGVTATGKPVFHIATTAACDTCHTQANTANYTTFLGATFVHSTPIGVCSTCHNGVNAKGKSAVHIPTTAACDTCHTQANTANYTTFLGATFAHSAPVGVCSTCHNGVFATGKPGIHVITTAACDVCHTQTNTANFTTFLGATFVHTTPIGVCSTCHNGVTALGKPPTHILTTADCSLCHTQANTANYTTFLGAIFTHATPPGVCSTCHNGVTALGKPTSHMVTASACDSCHTQANTANYTTFTGATGSVDHAAIPAGNCQSCHNGTTAKGLSAGHIPTGALTCDGCHAKFNGTSVTTFTPATMNHALVTATRCDTCHNGAYTTQGVQYGGAQAKVTRHIPTTITGTLDCTTCHATPVYTSATGWATVRMNHNGAQGGGVPVYCVTCHLSGTTYQGSMEKKSHKGTSVSKDCSSSSCHRPIGNKGAAYTRWD